MIDPTSGHSFPFAQAGTDPSSPPEGTTADSAFHDVLRSITQTGASYAALIHQNGISVAEATTLAFPHHKRDELAILSSALISASQALARSLNAGTCCGIRQQFDNGGLILHPLTAEHWLFVMAEDAPNLIEAESTLPAHISALQSLLAQNPTSPASARFMDDIEFADLSDVEFD